ncbi:MAG: 4Fe-4S dicluster domain-containing protein [Burkholderiales bacterium]|nr:4Fe-4S dicluster domain-containing protein [Burkholderiales bacterium]
MKPVNLTPTFPSSSAKADRRGFLGVAAAGLAGILLAPGVRLIEIAQAAPGQATAGASAKVRWGMLIDSTKCASGCTDCVTACNTENGLSGGTKSTDSQWIRKIEIKEIRTGKTQSLPMMCQHCAEPPCVDVCPTGASFKRADGIVLVDKHICIGCRYCVMACPYKARSFVHEPLSNQKPDVPRGMGTVEGCTMCVHKVDRGEQPACVQACSAAGHGAIVFGDLNDPNSEISKRVASYATRQVREDLNLNTGVRYIGI